MVVVSLLTLQTSPHTVDSSCLQKGEDRESREPVAVVHQHAAIRVEGHGEDSREAMGAVAQLIDAVVAEIPLVIGGFGSQRHAIDEGQREGIGKEVKLSIDSHMEAHLGICVGHQGDMR